MRGVHADAQVAIVDVRRGGDRPRVHDPEGVTPDAEGVLPFVVTVGGEESRLPSYAEERVRATGRDMSDGGARAVPSARIVTLDILRTAALVAMALYHFTYDLAFFGVLPSHMAVSGGWAVFARLVAGSFLFLSGVSLVLAHGRGVRWRSFLRRLAVIAAAAGMVTVASWLFAPERFIFFGILHAIAACSVIGLAFLRAPAGVTLSAAVLVWALPKAFRSEMFDAPWLWWTGLFTQRPASMDFEPIFPWLAAFLAGMAAARLLLGRGAPGWLGRLEARLPPRLVRLLSWPGRHSLVIYLLHQPVLVALVWAAMKILPA